MPSKLADGWSLRKLNDHGGAIALRTGSLLGKGARFVYKGVRQVWETDDYAVAVRESRPPPDLKIRKAGRFS